MIQAFTVLFQAPGLRNSRFGSSATIVVHLVARGILPETQWPEAVSGGASSDNYILGFLGNSNFSTGFG